MQNPSKAHLWSKCALSGAILAGRANGYTSPHAPDADSTDSRKEASAAYWLAGEWLAHRISPADSPVGITAPNGWLIDAEMAQHVEAYVEYVRGFGGQPVQQGQSVHIGSRISGRIDNAHVIIGPGLVVRVFMMKYGWRLVEVEGNAELLCYGIASHIQGHILELHVYQPRPYHPEGIARSWVIPPDQVDRWREWLDQRAMFAEGVYGTPHGMPGEHCRDCEGRNSCQALAANVYAAYEMITDTQLGKMDAKQLAAELDFLERAEEVLKHRKAGVEAEAEGRIAGGEFVEGWELVNKTGHRKFSVPMQQVFQMTGIHPYKQADMTPAELERAGAKKDIVKKITYTPTIGRKLARASAKAFERMFKK
jgi:hypothetical protein